MRNGQTLAIYRIWPRRSRRKIDLSRSINEKRGYMLNAERPTLQGEILSVTHSARSCRLVIELQGAPEMTAMLMKEATVKIGLAEHAVILAKPSAKHLTLAVCPNGACDLTDCTLPISS